MRKQRNQTQGADELLDSNLVYILAQYGRPILFQKIQEWSENIAYKLKARYHGEIPVICRQGRWYLPFFWMQHSVFAAMPFFVAPFLLLWASILRAKRELKWYPQMAQEKWEKDYVRCNTQPPLNYSI